MNKKDLKFVYFGTPEFSTIVLDELKKADYVPSLIITAPDKPVGRKHIMTPPPVKTWADKNNIECWQAEHPRDITDELSQRDEELFIIASYGYIISQKILDIPKYGVLNVHTSLLPKYRGASPIESAILNGDTETGSTIMKMVLKMDVGPILSQTIIPLDNKITKPELFEILAHDGGKLLAETIEPYINGDILEQEQEEEFATYCKKLTKEDGNLTDIKDENEKWNRYRAFYGWPGTFIFDGDLRLKITKAKFENEKFIIERIIPAGKKEMDYIQYLKNKGNQ
jgi:methionyl-tRNA formyltransferase